jgi:cellulose synthase/poly-beta-1,6-N-acetylglucosamine synthase-like glycosyltransferase
MPAGRVDAELAQQVEALAGQSYPDPWELVVSLNSPDPDQRRMLEDVLAAHPGLNARIVDSSDHRSASHARNVGAASAQGRVLLFCDSDDVAHTNWIDQLASALDYYGAVGGYLDEDVLSVPGQEHWRPPATPGALPTFLGHPFLVSANMGVTRTNFEEVGGFDTDLVRGEDIALSWDLLELGVELGYCSDAVIYYRHRRGLQAMMHQHYLYGRGFSQILSRRGTPGSGSESGLRALKPNGQSVAKKSLPYFLRRGSIAAGRVVGLVEERVRR